MISKNFARCLISDKLRDHIKELRRRGLSYREISRKTKASYTSVQRICNDVRMSGQGVSRYYSKVKGIKKEIRVNSLHLKNKIRIICNLIFDGSVYKSKGYHYCIMYVNSSLELVNQFKRDMKMVYMIDPSSYEKCKGKHNLYYRIKYISKEIFLDLKNMVDSYHSAKTKLPLSIIQGKSDYKIIALRSFWDNEGSISKDGKLSADLKNLNLIKQLLKIHKDFGICCYVSRYWKNGWAYKLILSKNEDNYKRFIKLRLFSDSVVTKGFFVGKKKLEVLNKIFFHDNKRKMSL